MVSTSQDVYTLAELAAEVGMTVRNVRSYQTRSLIPPPIRNGRTCVYTRDHLQRLRQIKQARARGASLTLIKMHIRDGGTISDDIGEQWLVPDRPPKVDIEVPAELLTPETRPSMEQLMSAGVVYQYSRHVMANASIVQAFAAAQHQGVPAKQCVQAAAYAVQAAIHVQQCAHIDAEQQTQTGLMYDDPARLALATVCIAAFTAVLT